ncbi:Cytochrome P450 71A12 [Cytospora mali]|uniref:Cytochrome P450 71A12 n=1 Tax=Cytospora mali TaxID=578113 RepID=A0A194V0E2_CYTMA|nr:Cytochrome P450 71A12 [Valsa mali var. pyri (nom. inval.)]
MSFASSNLAFLFFVGIVTLAYIATRKLFSHDPREPPLAPQSIPIIGHLIGLSRSKFNYYMVQKQYKVLAFPPIEAKFASKDASLWGFNVAEFNPYRFLPEEKQNRLRDVCFRAFGGGKTLCPGRHFATNEILAVVAVFVSRLE